jgi:hypothetical protein
MGIVSRSQGGGGGGATILFDSTLGADTASIDTGAGGIAGTQNVLEAWVLARTDEAVILSTINITFNNDGGANYDFENFTATNAALAGGGGVAATAINFNCHGASGGASYASAFCICIPSYAQSTFFKTGFIAGNIVDTAAANCQLYEKAIGYRSTVAISRMKVAPGGGTVLKAGSRLLILGR